VEISEIQTRGNGKWKEYRGSLEDYGSVADGGEGHQRLDLLTNSNANHKAFKHGPQENTEYYYYIHPNGTEEWGESVKMSKIQGGGNYIEEGYPAGVYPGYSGGMEDSGKGNHPPDPSKIFQQLDDDGPRINAYDMFEEAEVTAKPIKVIHTKDMNQFEPTDDGIFDMFRSTVDQDALEDGVRVGFVDEMQKAIDKFDRKADADGYYSMNMGEKIANRFSILQPKTIGKGSFSTVVRAIDLKVNNKTVAVKIIRNYGTMFERAKKEADILRLLVKSDPRDERYLVRFLGHTTHQGHMCLMFENLHQNLRELCTEASKNGQQGLPLTKIGTFAKQLLKALTLMKKLKLIHADIKPDNILAHESQKYVKLADLGSAFYDHEILITPMMGSRWYRSPEVILGLEYDFAIDIWGLGCTLFELFAGRPLFRGGTNHDMLKLFCKSRGSFPHKVLKRGKFTMEHFDETGRFREHKQDKKTGKTTTTLTTIRMDSALSKILASCRGVDTTSAMFVRFQDLLEQMLDLDPWRRIRPEAALRHPFITTLLNDHTDHCDDHVDHVHADGRTHITSR